MISEKKGKIRERSRILTQTTSNSFYSVSTSSHSAKNQSHASQTLFESELFIESPLENDIFPKTLELYFRVNSKVEEVNCKCIEILQTQNQIQRIKSEYNFKLEHLQDFYADKTVRLLENSGDIEVLEGKVSNFQDQVIEKEKNNEKEKEEVTSIVNEINKARKNMEDMNLIYAEMKKYENTIKKLEIFRNELQYEKESLGGHFKTLHGQHLMRNINRENIEEIQKLIKLNRNKIEKKISEVENTKLNIKKIEEDFIEIEMVNAEKLEEIKSLNQKIKDKNNDILMRKQWLRDYRFKIESNKALNRCLTKQIEAKIEENKRKKEKFGEIENDVDKKDLKIEIEEFQQKNIEKGFSERISEMMKKYKSLQKKQI